MEPTLICKRLDRLVTDRKRAEERWQLIEEHVAPYRGEFFMDIDSESAVPLDKGEVYDGTALQCSQTLASNLHGNLTSPYVQWFNLAFKNSELMDDPDAREWLEQVALVIWQTLQESNFSREVAEAYLDLTTFATTFMFEEATDPLVWKGATFSSLPLKECFFEEDSEGKISHFYRWLKWTPLQLVDKFGDKVPADIAEEAKGLNATSRRYDLVFCVWRRNKKDPQKAAPKKRPWGCRYVLKRDQLPLSDEGGYYQMPVFATRWAKVSESVWGHGPSHVAIYDVMALNRQEKLTMQALEKTIDPPQKVTERGVLGDVDLQAGGMTVVRSMDDIEPMMFGTEWNVVNSERQNRRNMIREYYLVSKLDLKESPAMTATEVERRWQQMQKLLGPTLGRLQADLLGPVIENTFGLLSRAGKLPEIPMALRDSQADLEIEYTGPLPVAQKADIAGAIERELGLASNLAATFGPEALDGIDAAKAVREHARLTAVPAKILRSDKEISKVRDDRAKQQQQAAAMAQAEQMSKVMANAGAGQKSVAEAKALGGGGEVAAAPAANEDAANAAAQA